MYADAIARALRGLQVFYRSQMGDGTAFVLSSPVVETYHTSHTADWYKGAGTFGSMFSQGTAEARNVAGVVSGTVVIYIDADIACGDSGSGGRAGSFGAAVLPANDLQGPRVGAARRHLSQRFDERRRILPMGRRAGT